MKVTHDTETEEVVLSFSFLHREMAIVILEDAIKRYEDAGFKCDSVIAILLRLYETRTQIH